MCQMKRSHLERRKNNLDYRIDFGVCTMSILLIDGFVMFIWFRASVRFQNLEVRDWKLSDIGSHII
jgi:hypothetical protein